MAASVFISFAAKDRETAETICSALEGRGFECWISSRNIRPGENFAEAIVRAIRSVRVMLLVFSSNFNNSDEVKKEVVLAGQNKLFVIPLRVEDVMPNEALTYEFATRQWIDFFGDWDRALEDLTAQLSAIVALEPPPRNDDEGARGSRTRRAARASEAITREHHAEPDAGHTEHTNHHPHEADGLYELGNTHAKNGDYDLAIEQYDQALRIKPDHAGAHNNRGNAFQAKGLYDPAIADFDRAIALKPDFAAAYSNRGNAFQARGEYDRAIHDYDTALRLKPDFAVALDNRAKAYERKGLTDAAKRDRAAAAALKGPASATGGPPPPVKGGPNPLVISGAILGVLLLVAVVVGFASKPSYSTDSSTPASDSAAASDASASAADTSAPDSASSAAPDQTQQATAAPTWTTTSTDGKDRQIKFVNQSSHAVFHIFAWSTDQTEAAGHDLMPDADVISTNDSKTYNVDDGANHCNYNFKATRADGAPPVYVNNIEVCGTEQVAFTD